MKSILFLENSIILTPFYFYNYCSIPCPIFINIKSFFTQFLFLYVSYVFYSNDYIFCVTKKFILFVMQNCFLQQLVSRSFYILMRIWDMAGRE